MKAKSLVLWCVIAGLAVMFATILALAGCHREWPLKPGEVKIINFTPQGLLERPQDMEITFSGPVVQGKDIGHEVDTKLIKTVPELEKSCRWQDESVVRCYLAKFKPKTSYHVEVAKEIIPKQSKLKLVRNREFFFTLPGLKVMNVTLSFLSWRDPPLASLVIDFNMPVVATDVPNRLKLLAPDGKPIAYSVVSSGENSRLEISAYLQGFRKLKWQAVTLKIDASLANASKISTLEKPFERRINLPAITTLRVQSAAPVQQEKVSYIQDRKSVV